ncbi:hypothetical protein U1872_11640 [Sphingomonas sp. RB3P16]|uniref:hypothetical protein n=1 Tax=Parasphingomonas frigoris TaxID=3096163 RepID=UPI002FC602EC
MDDPALPVPDAVSPGLASVDSAPVDRPPPRLLPPYTPAPPPPAARGISWRAGIALGLLTFLIGVALAAFIITRYLAPSDSKTATVTLPVSNGQPPLVILPSKTAVPAATIDLAAVSSREAELAAKIDDLEARAAAIDRDSQRAAGYATRSEGLMVAFAARRAIDRGLNLGFLESQVRERFGATRPAAVATIVRAARDPVTLEDLRAGLDGVAPELMTGAASVGWWQSLRTELGNLVVLRRAGTPSPLPVDRVARARRLLEAGQVEAALAEVSRTPGAAQAERWTSAARRYIDARRALDTIETAAVQVPGVAATAALVEPLPAASDDSAESPAPTPTATAPAAAAPTR